MGGSKYRSCKRYAGFNFLASISVVADLINLLWIAMEGLLAGSLAPYTAGYKRVSGQDMYLRGQHQADYTKLHHPPPKLLQQLGCHPL